MVFRERLKEGAFIKTQAWNTRPSGVLLAWATEPPVLPLVNNGEIVWEPGDFFLLFFSPLPASESHNILQKDYVQKARKQEPVGRFATFQLTLSNTFLPIQKFHILKDTLFAGMHMYTRKQEQNLKGWKQSEHPS